MQVYRDTKLHIKELNKHQEGRKKVFPYRYQEVVPGNNHITIKLKEFKAGTNPLK